jgi:peptide/nickel transport system substrate-binding protein
LPKSPGNLNNAQFCDRGIDRQIERAVSLQATDPDAARRRWESIDRQLADQAPWVPLVNLKSVDIVSKRVGNYQNSPSIGVLIDQLWVR